jgi:hypothetical protein
MGNNNSSSGTSNIESNHERIKNSYFNTIKKIRRKFYLKNENNLQNILISFENKTFDSILSIESNNSNNKYINWIDYFYDYLYFLDEKKIEWATNLIESLDNEYFLSENKYLSLFFFEEFSIKTKPNCIQNLYTNEKKNTKLNCSELNITTNLGGSFVSINIENLLPGDPAIEYKKIRSEVKKYISLFKEHISKEDHPIHIIAKKFSKVFCNYINNKINNLQNNVDYLNHMISNITDDITFQLQTFIIKLQITLKLMYCKTLDFSCFKNEKDELVNIVTSLIFRVGNLNQKIYDLYSLSLKSSLKNLEQKLDSFNNIKPEDLGINKSFCLNNVTLNYQLELIEKLIDKNLFNQNKKEFEKNLNIDSVKKNEILQIKDLIIKKKSHTPLVFNKLSSKKVKEYNNESIFFLEKENTFEDEIPNNLGAILPEDNNRSNDFKKEDNKNEKKGITKHNFIHPQKKKFLQLNDKKPKDFIYSPYTVCISLIKNLKKYKTPIEKIMIIASLSDEIIDSVNEFWEDLNKYIDNKIVAIDSSQLLKILLYIIIKSKTCDIIVHCKIITLFTTCIMKNSTIGNCFSNFEASISKLMQIKNIDEILEKNNLNSNENEINTNIN